jgi:hypothetical protein
MRTLPAILSITGAILLLISFTLANHIPKSSREEAIAYSREQNGAMSELEFREFIQMSFQRILLQNIYLGSTGLVLLVAGVIHLSRNRE